VRAVLFLLVVLLASASHADIQNVPYPGEATEQGGVSVPAGTPSQGVTGLAPEPNDIPFVPGQPVAVEQGAAPVLEGPAPNGAVNAMLAIAPKYIEGIVLVTGKNGRPQPKKWVVVARDSNDLGTLHKITVEDGQVVADAQSMNVFEALRQDVSINPQTVQCDSPAAFAIAERYAAANQKVIGHADYALTIRGTDAAPIWTVNCFSSQGFFIGKVVLLATTGSVVSHQGFANSPQ